MPIARASISSTAVFTNNNFVLVSVDGESWVKGAVMELLNTTNNATCSLLSCWDKGHIM